MDSSFKITQSKEYSVYNRHADADFTFAIERQMRDIVSLFGPDNVFVFSVDDKGKVPIGVTAVTKQCMWAMKINYQIMIL